MKKSYKGEENPFYGKKHTEETKIKMRLAKIGKPSPNKGKKSSLHTREKISESLKGLYEEKSRNWKGNDVGYLGLHVWVAKKLGKPKKCEHCGKDNLVGRQIHWANKSQKYKRDISDWIRLCASCHCKYDDIHSKMWKTRKNKNFTS